MIQGGQVAYFSNVYILSPPSFQTMNVYITTNCSCLPEAEQTQKSKFLHLLNGCWGPAAAKQQHEPLSLTPYQKTYSWKVCKLKSSRRSRVHYLQNFERPALMYLCRLRWHPQCQWRSKAVQHLTATGGLEQSSFHRHGPPPDQMSPAEFSPD